MTAITTDPFLNIMQKIIALYNKIITSDRYQTLNKTKQKEEDISIMQQQLCIQSIFLLSTTIRIISTLPKTRMSSYYLTK